MKKVRKPKAPKLNASEATWSRYKSKLREWQAYKKKLDARRKLRDS
jgi:hypothetical protein